MVIDFNDNWLWYKNGKDPQSVHLPHDAMIHEKRSRSANNGSRTGYFPGGQYIYEKEWTVTAEMMGKYVAIGFGGVYRHAAVIVNGQKAGYQAYGYSEFEIDISDVIREGRNTIRVEVDNSYTPNSRWYSGSGIIRPVHLIVKDKKRLTDIFVRTQSIRPAKIEVRSSVIGDEKADIKVEIYDGEVLVTSGDIGELLIPDARLWSEETPHLYTALIRSGTDQAEIHFGIRTLSWDAKTGFMVNGKETKLRGCCIHSDNGILGACSFADAEERKVRILKEAGYNAIRSSHNPCSGELLDACDKYGMYVIDELYDGWYIPKTYHDSARDFEQTWEQDARAMVRKDLNHPSVSCIRLEMR